MLIASYTECMLVFIKVVLISWIFTKKRLHKHCYFTIISGGKWFNCETTSIIYIAVDHLIYSQALFSVLSQTKLDRPARTGERWRSFVRPALT